MDKFFQTGSNESQWIAMNMFFWADSLQKPGHRHHPVIAQGRIGQIALSSNGSAPFTPIQAMSSIAALAKLQQRDLAAASVFTSVLCGMGSHIHWSWVKSPYYFRHLKLGEGLWSCPFEAMACRRFLEGIQTSHCVEVLHSLSSLELSSRLTVHLTAMLCSILAPQLHDLRAKEVLVVARAFSVDRIPDSLWNGAEEPSRWRERALDHCFQSLRRHEHFLDTSYFTLLPFKLLCCLFAARHLHYFNLFHNPLQGDLWCLTRRSQKGIKRFRQEGKTRVFAWATNLSSLRFDYHIFYSGVSRYGRYGGMIHIIVVKCQDIVVVTESCAIEHQMPLRLVSLCPLSFSCLASRMFSQRFPPTKPPGLQVNLGIFGTRKLEDFLNPMLLAFVERLKLVAWSVFFCNVTDIPKDWMVNSQEKHGVKVMVAIVVIHCDHFTSGSLFH